MESGRFYMLNTEIKKRRQILKLCVEKRRFCGRTKNLDHKNCSNHVSIWVSIWFGPHITNETWTEAHTFRKQKRSNATHIVRVCVCVWWNKRQTIAPFQLRTLVSNDLIRKKHPQHLIPELCMSFLCFRFQIRWKRERANVCALAHSYVSKAKIKCDLSLH